MTTSRWYQLQTKAVATRYGLSKNAQTLLQSLDWYHDGSIDGAELGRLVRMSYNRRSSLTNTISLCAKMIGKDPKEQSTGLTIIEMCREILEIANRPETDAPAFPFMKLPEDIRDRILGMMIDIQAGRANAIRPFERSPCDCPSLLDMVYPKLNKLPTSLGPGLSQEFFRVFFRKKKVRFPCTCDLLEKLRKNPGLVENLRTAEINWCGPKSDEAFTMLAQCPRLEALELKVNDLTMAHLSKRAKLMQEYFTLTYRKPRLSDVLGLDELLELRGLREINVFTWTAYGRKIAIERERANLAELLRSRLKLPKEEE